MLTDWCVSDHSALQLASVNENLAALQYKLAAFYLPEKDMVLQQGKNAS